MICNLRSILSAIPICFNSGKTDLNTKLNCFKFQSIRIPTKATVVIKSLWDLLFFKNQHEKYKYDLVFQTFYLTNSLIKTDIISTLLLYKLKYKIWIKVLLSGDDHCLLNIILKHY